MDKQTQVDGGVGSDGGGSRSVGQVDGFPEIVTLCGSSRFKESFESENRRLTLEGRIVISLGLFGHLEGLDIGTDDAPTAIKVMLDQLHFRKIDVADRIHVINQGGYIGHSTRNEINYAISKGVQITYMEAASPAQAPGLSNTEGMADQSDSTNNQTAVPQTVNVEEEV